MEDDEIDKAILENIDKEITQEESINKEVVNEQLGGMGWLYDTVHKKLQKDGECYKCKKQVDIAQEKLHVVQATNTEKGVIAFVGLCETCVKELIEKGEK